MVTRTASWIFLMLWAFHFPVFAQLPDSIREIKVKPEKLMKSFNLREMKIDSFNYRENDFSGHWAGLDFGFNMLVHTKYTGYETEFLKNDVLLSNSLFLNPFQHSIRLSRNHPVVGLVTGSGILFQSFHLDRNTTLIKSPSGDILPKTLIFEDNQKSKFSVCYLIIPLLAEIQVPVSHYYNRIYFSAGIVGGYRLSSHTKIKYRLDRKKEKLKTPGDFSLHTFRPGFMFRVGYRGIHGFVNYDLQPLFKEGKGPEVTSLIFGVRLLSF